MSQDPNQGKCDCCRKHAATIQILDVDDWKITSDAKICPQCASGVMAQFSQSGIPLPATSDAITAAQLLDASEAGMDLSDLQSLAGGVESLKALGEKVAARVKCKGCGTSLRDFQKTGRLGCPECYESFGETIEPALERIHGNGRSAHVGRQPGQKQADQRNALIHRRKRLERELETAVESENYERAAQVRDEIQAIVSKLQEPHATS